MQRKRGSRPYYSDNSVELGGSLLPTSRGFMRKFKMKSLLKYAVFAIIMFIVYSVYEKISLLSKSTNQRDNSWTKDEVFDFEQFQGDGNNRPNNNQRVDDNLNQGEAYHKEEANKRVKEQINQVFEEFKQKQEQKDKDQRLDPFQIRATENVGNGGKPVNDEPKVQGNRYVKNGDTGKADLNNLNEGPDDYAIDKPDKDKDNELGDGFADIFGDDEDIDVDAIADAQEKGVDSNSDVDPGKDFGDHYEKVVENIVDNINDEEEHEDKEVVDEIEHRLAEVLKDAVNEVADEQAEASEDKHQANDGDAGDNVKQMAENVADQPPPESVQQVFEKKEFKVAVDQMDQKLNPEQMARLNEEAIRKQGRNDDDHEFPPFVTAAGTETYKKVIQLAASLQVNMPGKKLYIYDLDMNNDQKKHLMTFCGVRLRKFMKDLFPEYVRNFNSLHWKPLVIQTALAEFGHIFWINPQYRMNGKEFGSLLHVSHETGIVIVGPFASYTTYAATNPKLYEFIPSNKEKLSNTPHVEIRAMIIHNTPEVHTNVMKLYTACALEENCLAPPGSKWSCKFDFTGKKLAGCHRYDESAMNVLLKNWFDFDLSKFAVRNSYFRDYDPNYKPQLKLCRSAKDIRDIEL